jgi:hypothetical protein
MNETQFMRRISYPIQFCKSEAEAVANLERLIMGRQCGLDEGRQFYVTRLSCILDREAASFPEIPFGDFPFSKSQMKTLLGSLREVLSRENPE